MEFIFDDDISEEVLKIKQLIDFSSNINPFGVPNKVKKNIEQFWESVVKYPDFKYKTLKHSIIKYIKKYENFDVNFDQIFLGSGAMELIDIFISCVQSITIVVPSFIEYEIISKKYNKEIRFVSLNNDMKYDYEKIKENLIHTDSIIIGNPNNPSGNIIDKEFFEEILIHCEQYNKKVIVDEVFIEFTCEDTSLIKFTEKYKCLFIIRAFTKFFGMPSIRLGYCISSNRKLLAQLGNLQSNWNINSFAEYSAINSFEDSEYISKTKEWIKNEIPYMTENLRNISYIERVYSTNCNFMLCKLRNCNGKDLYSKLLLKNLLIRRCDNFRELSNKYIRLAIKFREENDILLQLLNQ